MLAESEKLAGEIKSTETIKRYAEKLMGMDAPGKRRTSELVI